MGAPLCAAFATARPAGTAEDAGGTVVALVSYRRCADAVCALRRAASGLQRRPAALLAARRLSAAAWGQAAERRVAAGGRRRTESGRIPSNGPAYRTTWDTEPQAFDCSTGRIVC